MMSKNEYQQVKDIVEKAVKLKQNKELAKAREVLESGLDAYPQNSYLKASLADLLYRQQQFNQAEKLADDILQYKPDDGRALTVKGNIAFRKREYKKARELFTAAYESDRTVYVAQRLARTLLRLEKFAEARRILEYWLEEEPEHEYLPKLAALLYEKMGDRERAEEIYEDYLGNKPQDQFAYKEKIKLRLNEKTPAEAVEELKNIIRLKNHEQNPHLHSLLGEKLLEMEKYSQAAEEYSRALELDPGNNFVSQKLGLCLYQAKDYKKALPHLKEAFRNDPGDYYTRSMLMKIFTELELFQEGIEFFQDVIRNNPGFEKLYGMIRKLEAKSGDNDDGKEN